MKCTLSLAAAALALAALAASQASAQNLFVNPGFEAPVTMDGPPFIGFWEAFQGAGATSANGAVTPRTGAQHLDLDITVDNSFAGAFQDVLVAPGLITTVSGWHLAPGPNDAIVEIRIEWRNSVSNTEISRTSNFSPAPTSAYTQFSRTDVVPLGVDTARVVYAIQSFDDSVPGNVGNVFVDDMSVTVIPEPSTLVLAGASLLGMIAIRRRRS
jgi:hypothetical protein